jgi:hypothetical protein
MIPCPKLVEQLQALVPVAMDDERIAVAAWTELPSEAGMTGCQVQRLFELTEEACHVQLWPVDMLDWALGVPTVLGLAEMVELRRAMAVRAPAPRQIGGAT